VEGHVRDDLNALSNARKQQLPQPPSSSAATPPPRRRALATLDANVVAGRSDRMISAVGGHALTKKKGNAQAGHIA
jgi:hypothetical protein